MLNLQLIQKNVTDYLSSLVRIRIMVPSTVTIYNVSGFISYLLLFLVPAIWAEVPSVLVAIIARNAQNSLPLVLGGLEIQSYDPQRLHIWVRTDCNLDRTAIVLQEWTKNVKDVYADVDYQELPCRRTREKFPFAKSDDRRRHVEELRDGALDAARQKNVEYILFLDSDAFLVDPASLGDFVAFKKDLVGPFLPSLNKYGNFWCNSTAENRYVRSSGCTSIFEFESTGIFQNFLATIRENQLDFFVTNSKQYGYSLAPLTNGSTFEDQLEFIKNIQLEVLVSRDAIPTSKYVSVDDEDLDTMGFDHVYLINLDRRPERRIRIEKSLAILGLEVERIPAVDGQNLDHAFLEGLKIRMLPGYSDPYKQRPMTMGEFGCFLSHYAIWRDVVDKGFGKVLVFEDDLRFDNYFRRRVSTVWKDIERLKLSWDLIYLGRKRLVDENEPFIRGSTNLVHVGYSYWTLCYMLSQSGAKKLLAGEPLSKVIPVDEYLPVMFDRHPNATWKSHFPNRDLVAFSVYPLLVYPSHYTGEFGYVSDTEDSTTVIEEKDEHQHDEL